MRQRPRTADGSINNDDARKKKELRRMRLEKYREAVRSSQCYGCATAVLSTIVVLLIMCMACILYYEYEAGSSGNTQQATAYLVNQRSRIMGTVRLYSEGGGVRIVAQMNGLEPNSRHGFKITEFSDLENGNGQVYNNEGNDVSHGCPDNSKTYRAGDLGNLVADNTGAAFYDWKSEKISLREVIGRTVVVDIEEDDCVSTSRTTNPLAQGSIGLENVDSIGTTSHENSVLKNNPLKRAHLRNKYKATLSKDGGFMDVSNSPIWVDNDEASSTVSSNDDVGTQDGGYDKEEEEEEEYFKDGKDIKRGGIYDDDDDDDDGNNDDVGDSLKERDDDKQNSDKKEDDDTFDEVSEEDIPSSSEDDVEDHNNEDNNHKDNLSEQTLQNARNEKEEEDEKQINAKEKAEDDEERLENQQNEQQEGDDEEQDEQREDDDEEQGEHREEDEKQQDSEQHQDNELQQQDNEQQQDNDQQQQDEEEQGEQQQEDEEQRDDSDPSPTESQNDNDGKTTTIKKMGMIRRSKRKTKMRLLKKMIIKVKTKKMMIKMKRKKIVMIRMKWIMITTMIKITMIIQK